MKIIHVLPSIILLPTKFITSPFLGILILFVYFICFVLKINYPQTNIIKNILNSNTLTILNIISENSKIYTKELMQILKEIEVNISKSQYYRYISGLKEYNLIQITWKNKSLEEKGYNYQITHDGLSVLNFFKEKNFEDKKY